MANRIKVEGIDKLLRILTELGSEKLAKSAQRKAARAGIGPIVKAEKANCPVDEGALKRSMARKITAHGFRVNAVAGADINYVEGDEQPGRYDHLVIRGHATEDGTMVPPNDFISRAADQAMGAAEAKYIEKLQSEIEKAADGD